MANEKLDNLKNLKKVKGFDIEEFDGVKSIIEDIELTPIEIKNFGKGDVEVRQLIVKSKNLTSDDNNPIQAIEYISLKQDKETKEFGIPENPNSKAMKFLRFFKEDSFDKIIGKDCMIIKRVNEKGEFLGIHYG